MSLSHYSVDPNKKIFISKEKFIFVKSSSDALEPQDVLCKLSTTHDIFIHKTCEVKILSQYL